MSLAVLAPTFLLVGCLYLAQTAGCSLSAAEEGPASWLSSGWNSVLVSPVLETFALAGLVWLLSHRWSNPLVISGLSALSWGLLHGALAWPSFFSATACFFLFTLAYLAWRPKSFWHAYLAAMVPHLVNNLVLISLSNWS